MASDGPVVKLARFEKGSTCVTFWRGCLLHQKLEWHSTPYMRVSLEPRDYHAAPVESLAPPWHRPSSQTLPCELIPNARIEEPEEILGNHTPHTTSRIPQGSGELLVQLRGARSTAVAFPMGTSNSVTSDDRNRARCARLCGTRREEVHLIGSSYSEYFPAGVACGRRPGHIGSG